MLKYNYKVIPTEYDNAAFIFPYLTQKELKQQDVYGFTCLSSFYNLMFKNVGYENQRYKDLKPLFKKNNKILVSFRNQTCGPENLDLLDQYLEKYNLPKTKIRKLKTKFTHIDTREYKGNAEYTSNLYIIDFGFEYFGKINSCYVFDIIRILRNRTNFNFNMSQSREFKNADLSKQI